MGSDPIWVSLGDGRFLAPSGAMIGHLDTGPVTPPPTWPLPNIGVDYSTASPSPEPWYYTDWGVVRVYQASQLSAALTRFPNVKAIALTDDPNWPRAGGAAVAASLRSALEGFYYSAGVYRTDRAGIQIRVANGNEVDREYMTGSLPTAVINTWAQMWAVVHELNGDGSRRYPMARMGVDLTVTQINSGGSGPRFKAIAPYCDFLASSLYPPGRSADPVVWNAYSAYLDGPLNVLADWNATYPNVAEMDCWEVGSPIDHAFDVTGLPNCCGGTTDWTIRPAYMEGHIQYLYDGCKDREVPLANWIYWNRMDNDDIPNPLKHDRAQAPNDTATRIHDYAITP